MRPLLSAALILAVVSCTADGPTASPDPTFQEVAPPTEGGSGEPYLSSDEDGVIMSWIQRLGDGRHALRVARLADDGWGEATTVAEGGDFFVNWADFPSVMTGGDGKLWAHWLQRVEGAGLAYAVRVASSSDGGVTWSEPWTPHEDGTPTEHGFVSLFPWQGGIGMTWLDGRQYAPGPDGSEPTREMTVRFRHAGAETGPGPEVLVDPRACDCCQTDVAVTGDGAVMVYRNRTEEEVRDIYVARWEDGAWQEGRPVHDDGWVIGGCPVNGPGVDARGQDVVVAWFTGAGDVPRVNAAFSSDGGRSFAAPIQVDGGNPAGRVDVRLRDDGSALLTWLERTDGDGAELRVARIEAGSGVIGEWVVARSSSARASGFPRMTLVPGSPSAMLVAWTDVSDAENPRVRLMRMELP